MKILSATFLGGMLCVLLGSGSINNLYVAAGDPSLSQNGKYLIYKNVPFQGVITERFDDGKIKSIAHYDKGLLHGELKTFYPDGSKESVRLYRNGEKEGIHQGWWPNGNLQFEYAFSEGSYHGSFKEWYDDGSKLHEFEYEHSEIVRATGWRTNGKTYINFVVRNGKKYGLTNSRLCYSLKDEQGVYQSTKQ